MPASAFTQSAVWDLSPRKGVLAGLYYGARSANRNGNRNGIDGSELVWILRVEPDGESYVMSAERWEKRNA